MTERECSDQPFAGFNYDYWFICTGCGERVRITAADYERQSTIQTTQYSQCRCRTLVDITQERPTLRNSQDPALLDDLVGQVYWYHSSRYELWPDVDSYTADVTESASGASKFGLNPDRIIDRKCGLALHLGTYEAAIENMFRRLHDQDVGDRSTIRYWLHRVRLTLQPGDLDPGVGEEFTTMFGDVELCDLYSRGGRASRYINLHEAIGSISLAVDPAVIQTVATIALPDELSAVPETSHAVDAVEIAVARLSEIEELRPDTSGISTSTLNFAALLPAPKDPDDPESVRTHRIAKQMRAYEDRWRAAWSELTGVLVAEYLPDVNEQVRGRFLDAVQPVDDPRGYHRRFRVMAGLLQNTDAIIGQFDSTPERRP